MQTDKQACRQTDRQQTYMQTDGKTSRQMERDADRWTDIENSGH